MLIQEFQLQNRGGLHARPATYLAQLVIHYQSKIEIFCENKQADAKSAIGLMTLGAGKGKTIQIRADGSDEERAIQEIISYLQGLGD